MTIDWEETDKHPKLKWTNGMNKNVIEVEI